MQPLILLTVLFVGLPFGIAYWIMFRHYERLQPDYDKTVKYYVLIFWVVICFIIAYGADYFYRIKTESTYNEQQY